ncbi:hypothetical protein [Gemmatimonas sp.]|uniref:hypothetical protein n=1 Tax=Gemmatimonas sp. TaxID=1962908 RepID=UPI00398338A1
MNTTTRTILRDTMQFIGVGLAVTVIGLIIGAVVVSPAVSHQQRLLGIAALFGIAAVVLAARLVIRALRTRPTRTTRQARQAPAPSITLRGGKSSRTPRAVAALAAAGANPTEIAWKTGLPVDAVSMLLEISGARTAALVG